MPAGSRSLQSGRCARRWSEEDAPSLHGLQELLVSGVFRLAEGAIVHSEAVGPECDGVALALDGLRGGAVRG